MSKNKEKPNDQRKLKMLEKTFFNEEIQEFISTIITNKLITESCLAFSVVSDVPCIFSFVKKSLFQSCGHNSSYHSSS